MYYCKYFAPGRYIRTLLSLQETSPLVWFQTNSCTCPRTWRVQQSILTFLCNFLLIPLRSCSKKVHESDPVSSTDAIRCGSAVCPICPQALCRRCALWQRCKNRRKEETSWWSRCPGSCGDGSGARTKTSPRPRRWRRCQLVPPGSVWRA